LSRIDGTVCRIEELADKKIPFEKVIISGRGEIFKREKQQPKSRRVGCAHRKTILFDGRSPSYILLLRVKKIIFYR